jgi:hypothetical protein
MPHIIHIGTKFILDMAQISRLIVGFAVLVGK